MKRLNAPKHWMLDKLTGVWVCGIFIIIVNGGVFIGFMVELVVLFRDG